MVSSIEYVEKRVVRESYDKGKPGKDKKKRKAKRGNIFIVCVCLRPCIRVPLSPLSAGISHTKSCLK